MKNLSFYLMATLVFFAACKKGDIGQDGPTGIAGPNGPMGNANVRLYSFDSRTSNIGLFEYKIANISKSFIDSSLVLAYYELSSTWYPVPGLGAAALYNTRYVFFQDNPSPSSYTMQVSLYNPSNTSPYTGTVIWDRFKIIIVPASVITIHGRYQANAPLSAAVDTKDYAAVCQYFNLPQ